MHRDFSWVDQWQEESELWESHSLEGANKPCYWLLLLRCWCDWDQQKNRGSFKYSGLQSARRRVAHYDEIPEPIFGELPDINDENASSVEDEEEMVLEDDAPHPFPQKDLNDLVCNLSLTKDSAELLASRLREKNSSLTVLASASFATGIRRTSIFSQQWRTLCTVQILRSFCSSLKGHSTNPKIENCSLTAASDHWNVFCYTTVTSLPLSPSLTRLHWRRSMKRWSMCWRKLVMISISGLFVLTWRWWTFCWDTVWLHQVPMFSVYVG